MSDLSVVFADAPPPVRVLCPLGRLLESTEDTDRARIQAWLDASHVAASVIADKFDAAGEKIGKDAVQEHRGGRCRCSKKPK